MPGLLPSALPMSSSGGLRSVLTDRSFWLGLLVLALGLIVFLLLMNYAVMPILTRHSSSVEVPSVQDLSPLQAERTLRLAGLDAERREQPFNPNLPPDMVVDQSPAGGTRVKPARRVYFYVNTSPADRVTMPNVLTMAQGQATAQIEGAGLRVGPVRYDTLRTPNENTVTRQIPEPDRAVQIGTQVSIWLSPGLDPSRRVTVPDVVGMPAEQARERLRAAGFWVSPTGAAVGRVRAQSLERGTTHPAGTEVVLTTDRSSAPPAPDSTGD